MSPFYRWGIRGTRRFTCSRPPNKMILWHFPGLFPPQSWVCSLLWRGSLCWWAFWSVGSLSEMVRAPEYPSSTASVYFDWFCGASVLQWGWGMGFRSFFSFFPLPSHRASGPLDLKPSLSFSEWGPVCPFMPKMPTSPAGSVRNTQPMAPVQTSWIRIFGGETQTEPASLINKSENCCWKRSSDIYKNNWLTDRPIDCMDEPPWCVSQGARPRGKFLNFLPIFTAWFFCASKTVLKIKCFYFFCFF